MSFKKLVKKACKFHGIVIYKYDDKTIRFTINDEIPAEMTKISKDEWIGTLYPAGFWEQETSIWASKKVVALYCLAYSAKLLTIDNLMEKCDD
jgi:hypothetical protein